MQEKNSDLFESLTTMNSSRNIVLYIGISFVLLGFIHYFFRIPSEYIVSISCSAFFFVGADYLNMDLEESKTSRFMQPFYLFAGVFSFIVLPVLIITFPMKFEGLIQSSEVFSIVSLGFVLVIYNRKTKQSQSKFYNIVREKFVKSVELMERTEIAFERLELTIEELEKENKELKSKIIEDLNIEKN